MSSMIGLATNHTTVHCDRGFMSLYPQAFVVHPASDFYQRRLYKSSLSMQPFNPQIPHMKRYFMKDISCDSQP